jgi:LCP family protein required for cell wall assembly
MKIKKIAAIIAVLAAVISVSAGIYGYRILRRVNTVKISRNPEDLGIKEEPGAVEEKNEIEGQIINIVLLGGDRRSKNDPGRTDSIIVASIDAVHNKIKLSSFMRDMYVDIYGHGKTKLNNAYFFGGPQLMIRTLNENFNLNIKDYVFVDFFSLEKLIDALGGVDIDVTSAEILLINDCIKEQASLKGTSPNLISSPGFQTLSGEQAVAYSRIRHIGNGDFDRTESQREVLSILFDKIQSTGPLKYPYLASQLLPCVETSLDSSQIIKLGTDIFKSGIKNIEQARYPMDKYCSGKIIDRIWYLVFDMEATKKQVHQFIYDDYMPGTPQKQAQAKLLRQFKTQSPVI